MAESRQAPAKFPSDGLVPLESVLRTEELTRRPSRPPDFERENGALVSLVQALADSPRTVLQRLAETILDVLRADSGGLSLLTKDGTRFHWPAIAGVWQPHIGGGTPREFGPCGDVLDRNAPLLFTHFERRYTYFLPVTPPVEECLLVPFYVDGKAVGTIWAIAHDDRRKFDAEDMRILVSLGRFASSAYQTVAFVEALDRRDTVLQRSQHDLSERVTTLQTANVEVDDARRAALNVMEDAVQSRQAAQALNVELRASEKRYRTLFESIDEGFCIIEKVVGEAGDPLDFRYLEANPAFAEQTGVGDVVGRTIRQAFPGESEEWFATYDNIVNTGEPIRFERGLVTQGRVLELYAFRVDDDTHRRVAVLFKDITERKQAELKLHDSEQRFTRFMHHLPGLAWIKDAKGRYVYANDAAARVFRTRLNDLYGRTDHEVFPLKTAAQFIQNDRQALDNGSSVQTVEALEHEDGVIHHSIVNKFAIPGLAGEAVMVGGVAIDITELKQAEEALRASQERLQLSQQVARVGTFDWNISTGVNLWTPELERIYGLQPGEFARTQSAWELLIYPDDRPEALRRINLAVETGEPGEAEWRVVWPDGQVRWLAARFQAFKDSSGTPVRLTGVNLDITERKQYEEALSESDRHKNEFLAMLAHELRNPLAPILVSIEILRRMQRPGETDGSHHQYQQLQQHQQLQQPTDRPDAPDDASRRVGHALDVLRRQVGQMVRLVDDLLDAGRISRGKIELRRERVELSSIIHHVLEAVRPISEGRDLELSINLPTVPVYVNADPTRLAQIVGNLLNNACKFTDRGGHIWLRVEREEQSADDRLEGESGLASPQVAIRVRDTGIGIAPDQLEHVFEMFTQIDTSLERSSTGLGIGLTLVRTLTEMHGGTVGVSSAGLGRGSEFVVRLPIEVEATIPTPVAATTDPVSMEPLRILIVDDNRDSADMLAMLLTFTGHATFTAHDGAAAVEDAASLDPDVILLDIGLPGLNGYEAARRIRQQQRDGRRPVLVALTGWGQDEDRRRSEEAGFDAHLVKPVDEVVLGKLLGRLTARPHSGAEKS
jgi:PAS domain S-box-containing protein